MRKRKYVAPILSMISSLMLFILSGCTAGPSSYLRTTPLDPESHVRAAIIPFVNLSPEREAEKKVVYSLVTHLLNSNYFSIVEMGEVQKAIQEAKVRKDEALSVEQIKAIGNLIGTEVLLMGAVEEYKIDSGTMLGEKIFVPEVSVSARLVSTKDGSIIWSANHHRRGDDQVTVFGMGRIDSISELTDVIVGDIVQALVGAMNKRKDAVVILKNGYIPHAEEKNAAEAPKPPEPIISEPSRDERVAEEIEKLKREKVNLANELAALKKKMGEQENTPKETESESAIEQQPVTPTEPPASSEAKDPRQVIKDQYQTEYEKIKSGYK